MNETRRDARTSHRCGDGCFCIFPGPGLPLLLVGAMLLAERSRRMARTLDWAELKVRNAMNRIKQWWQEASPAAKNAAIILSALVIAGAGYGAYQILH